jgi:hypothetical protein
LCSEERPPGQEGGEACEKGWTGCCLYLNHTVDQERQPKAGEGGEGWKRLMMLCFLPSRMVEKNGGAILCFSFLLLSSAVSKKPGKVSRERGWKLDVLSQKEMRNQLESFLKLGKKKNRTVENRGTVTQALKT